MRFDTPLSQRCRFVPRGGSFSGKPGGTLSFVTLGVEGSSFQHILEHVTGSGGHFHHSHSRDERIVGKVTPSSGRLIGRYPQNIPVLYQATNFCGTIKFTTKFTVGADYVNIIDVRFDGLQKLLPHPRLKVYTNDPKHPQNDYGRPELLSALSRLADAYSKVFPKGQLWVNDMSLPWGGIFDVKGTIADPDMGHSGHKWGGEVDISDLHMTDQERTWFRVNVHTFFNSAILHGRPLHWHCGIWPTAHEPQEHSEV